MSKSRKFRKMIAWKLRLFAHKIDPDTVNIPSVWIKPVGDVRDVSATITITNEYGEGQTWTYYPSDLSAVS